MIRTRFAPSPTGFLHVGGLRTALYNYLFAKRNAGRFILRIEDTDQNRKVPGAIENLIETLKWANVIPDEGPEFGGDFGPYIQSQRLDIYRQHIQSLIEKGHAYYCFCSIDRLDALRKQQTAEHRQPRYDNHCRSRSFGTDVRQRLSNNEPYVIRMKTPETGTVEIHDLIRGDVPFPADQLDDQVLMKSDGFPTYHLANVVDDHLMQISHVIRGEEWLPSTPKHQLLYNYFGWDSPQFAHLSLLLNPDKSKLSKRQGDVAAEDYRKKGYLPEALINFLALLGWNPGTDQEIFSMEELIREFSLERVGKSGAIFNVEKLDWMNGHYIRTLSPEKLFHLSSGFLPDRNGWNDSQTISALAAIQESLTTFSELPEKTRLFFTEAVNYDAPDLQEYLDKPEAVTILESLISQIEVIQDFNGDSFVLAIKTVQKTTGIKGKPLWMTIRAALTGETHGPEIHVITNILSRETCARRLQSALEYARRQTARN